MRATFLPFALPDLGEAEERNVLDALRSGWITTGPKVRAFEAAFAAAVGAQHAVAVNSGTAALHLALEAIGLQAGDEVILPTYTFAATAEVVRYFGAQPVLVDSEATTLNLSLSAVEAALTPRTKAIIPVHMAGLPADLDALHRLACDHGLLVIEDAAHAFPTRYHDRPIGGLSAFTCFSFYPTKPITTGEGGMLCTNDAAWADRCRTMALHGISKDAVSRYAEEGSWYYEIQAPGFKYNMTDIAAALGLAQLARAEAMRARRAAIAARYDAAFRKVPGLQIPAGPGPHQHAWHLYQLRLHLGQLQLDRAQFIAALKARNIGTSVHFIPLHLHPYYRTTYGYQPEDFPVAYHEYRREISLPLYSRMQDTDIDDVIAAVLDVEATYRRHA